MFPALFSISALLISIAFLMLGHGLLLLLLPLYAGSLNFTDSQVALTGSAYFIGFVTGCLASPYLLKRVGHIRSFAVLATSYSALVALFALIPHFYAWLGFRVLVGASISGLYVIVESWLSDRSEPESRGSILSIYTMLNMTMIMAGQQLLNLGNLDSLVLFALAAVFISLSIIPVSLTLSLAPAAVHHVRPHIGNLWHHSPVAFFSAIVAGMVTGSYWSLAPVYASSVGLDSKALAAFISASILGGACCQWPLGRISDSVDRRIVIMNVALSGALVSMAFALMTWMDSGFSSWTTFVASFLWGGSCMTLYALSLAHANDNAEPSEFVSIGSAMLITLGVSSAIGAPIAALFMDHIGPAGLYVFASSCLFILVFIVILRRYQRVITLSDDEKDSFQAATDMAGPTIYEIDPRNDEEFEDESEKVDVDHESERNQPTKGHQGDCG